MPGVAVSKPTTSIIPTSPGSAIEKPEQIKNETWGIIGQANLLN